VKKKEGEVRPGNKANAGKVRDKKRQVWASTARMLSYKQQLPRPPPLNLLSPSIYEIMPTCLSNTLQPHIDQLSFS